MQKLHTCQLTFIDIEGVKKHDKLKHYTGKMIASPAALNSKKSLSGKMIASPAARDSKKSLSDR